MQLPELEPSQLTGAKWQAIGAEEHALYIFHRLLGTFGALYGQ